jgi:hypothetical protein
MDTSRAFDAFLFRRALRKRMLLLDPRQPFGVAQGRL